MHFQSYKFRRDQFRATNFPEPVSPFVRHGATKVLQCAYQCFSIINVAPVYCY
jgi:hypothetical protein